MSETGGMRQRRVAIVGTGFAGLCAGIQLKLAGYTDLTLFEKADRVGGTWRENTYPGAECDIPSALYSYSFERNPNWTHKWSEQPEILAYLEHCATKYGLMPHIRFNHTIVDARFDEALGKWLLTAEGCEPKAFDVFICAVGQLHKPSIPPYEGRDTFAGPSFHSAQWEHDVPLDGKRVGVIGNAASAIQFIPQIAPQVSALTIFQRSANWIIPKPDREYTAIEKAIGTAFPIWTKLYRFAIWFQGESAIYSVVTRKGWKPMQALVRRKSLQYLKQKVADPELRKILTPDYPMGAKRVLFSADYYDAVVRDNVDIVTEPIERIVPEGVKTRDGAVHEADVLIYATGFNSTDFLTPMLVAGRNGEVLNERWQREGAEAYLGITHTGYPNFFILYGPNTNLGHNSIVIMIEAQVRYILSCLNALERRDAQWLDVKEDVQRDYNAWVQERLKDMTWNAVKQSWYMTETGKITNNWVGRTTEYIRKTKAMKAEEYGFG